jgi:hypothetical protein
VDFDFANGCCFLESVVVDSYMRAGRKMEGDEPDRVYIKFVVAIQVHGCEAAQASTISIELDVVRAGIMMQRQRWLGYTERRKK